MDTYLSQASEVVPWEDNPAKGCWKFPTLSSQTVDGKILLWQIGYDEETSELVITHGYVDGAKQSTRRKVETNSSGRTLQEQAFLEARKRYTDRMLKGAQPLDCETTQYNYVRQMTANTYKPPSNSRKKGGKQQIGRFPVGVQPKLDGCRALARKNRLPKNIFYNTLSLILSMMVQCATRVVTICFSKL